MKEGNPSAMEGSQGSRRVENVDVVAEIVSVVSRGKANEATGSRFLRGW